MKGKEITLASVLGTLPATSWSPPKELTFEQWATFGEQLVRMESGVQWWVGDWWRNGTPYGDRVETVKEKLPLKITSCANMRGSAKMYQYESTH